jgi:hypothetical protein
MKMRRPRILLYGCVWTAICLHARDDLVARHKARMDSAQDVRDDLQDALDAKSSVKVAESAGKLVEFGQREREYWSAAGISAAVKLSQNNLEAARAIEVTAKAGNFEGARAAFVHLNDTCRACHDLHPEKQLPKKK